MVFLLGGRHSCNNCTYIRETVVNATNPPLNQMMEECFVAWFCNCDANTDEQEPYEAGLGGYSLPLMCWIDPDIRLGAYLDRRTGPLDDPVMLLLLRKAIRKVAPKAQNLIDRQIVVDPSFAVHGRLFTNLLATQVFYQINDAPWAEALTQGPSACKTNWSVSLAAHTLRLGADANRLRIYAVYADRSRSPTNTLTFTHAPPPLQITQHPTPVLTLVGHEASFSVLASNATSFTGYHHGSNAAVGIGPTLRLPRAHLSDGGYYYCASSNSVGGLLSTSVPLVLFEPHITPEHLLGLRVQGPAGQLVSLMGKTSLQDPAWTLLTNRTLGSGPLDLMDQASGGKTSRFYKLRLP